MNYKVKSIKEQICPVEGCSSEIAIIGKYRQKTLLLGLKDHGSVPFSLNAIVLITKRYLFQCLKDGCKPSFKALQLNIKRVYDEQSYLHVIADSTDLFKKKWMLVSNLIQTI